MTNKMMPKILSLLIDFVLIVWSAGNVLLIALEYDMYYFTTFLILGSLGLLSMVTISRKDIPRMLKESEKLPYILGIILTLFALFPEFRNREFGFYVFINLAVLGASTATLLHKISSTKKDNPMRNNYKK